MTMDYSRYTLLDIYILFNIVLSSLQLNCTKPHTVVEWNELPYNVLITFKTNGTTFQQVYCNSTNSSNESEIQNDQEKQMEALIIQKNASIRFYIEELSDSQQVGLYQVNRINFLNCNTSEGTPLERVNHTELIVFNEGILLPGSKYFIVDIFELCTEGFRVNVTVADNDCTAENKSIELCNGNGFCTNHISETYFTCNCSDGFGGNNCEIENRLDSRKLVKDKTGSQLMETFSDPCSLNPCLNNGTCIVTDLNHTKCLCADGFTGSLCLSHDECLSSPCVNGICIQENNAVQCYCQPGYYGSRCEKEYNECSSKPCYHRGQCTDLVDDYKCHCTKGYTGKSCTKKVNLCKPMPCVNGSLCIDSGDNFHCVCKEGYTGTHCEIDINECDSQPCFHGGTCHDLINGFRCQCAETHAGFHCEFSLDVFAPPIDSEMPDGKSHVNNLYIVAGTLLGALMIVLSVVAGCYCKIHETYRNFRWRRFRNSITKTASESSLEVSSVNTPRLSIDAIWEATALTKDCTYRSTNYSDSLQTKIV